MNIRLTKRLAFVLVGIWLVGTGLTGLGLSFPGLGTLLAVLAVAAGIVLLLER